MKDINLLPDDIRVSEDQFKPVGKSSSPVRVVTIVIAVLVLVLATFLLPKIWIIAINSQLVATNKAIESADYNEVKQLKSDIVKVQDKVKLKNEIITDIDAKSVSVSGIFNIVGSTMPKGCSIDRINFNEDVFSLQGKSETGSKASEFLSNISRISSLSVMDSSVDSSEGAYNFKYTFTFDRKGGN